MTSRSPRGTEISAGVNRMSLAVTLYRRRVPGRCDVGGGGLRGAGDVEPCRGGVEADAEGGADGDDGHGRDELGTGPGLRSGLCRQGHDLGLRGLGRRARLLAGCGCGLLCLLGADGGSQAPQQQGDRQGQGDERQRREDDTDQARHGQQAERQPEVGDGDAGGAPALELGHAGAKDGRAAADDDGKQVRERSEEDLEGEADDEDRCQRTVVVGERLP